jgi:reductive dehalogenase
VSRLNRAGLCAITTWFQDPLMIVLFVITGAAAALFVFGFALASIREGEKRAARTALLLGAGFAVSWFALGFLLPGWTTAMAAGAWGAALLFTAILLLPVGKKASLRIDEDMKASVDERDTLFARMNLEEGSEAFETYYGRMRPELAGTDSSIRTLPRLHEPGGRHYDPDQMAYSRALFDIIEELRPLSEPPPAPRQSAESAALSTRRVRTLLRSMGAADCRITRLRPRHLYTHLGRGREAWGRENTLDHAFVIVFSVEMDYAAVRNAPRAAMLTESATAYMRGAAMAVVLADLCASLGFRARAHFDANYGILLPAAAHDAGLGEMGRLGLLITPRLGPRVRLAAVTTDLPLEEDGRISFGVQDFCSFCLKCAESCPGGAISRGEKKDCAGAEKWQSSQEACYRVWRRLGTDCGLCLSLCPYSKPDTFYHRLVRYLCGRSAISRRLALRLDDLFYGRR